MTIPGRACSITGPTTEPRGPRLARPALALLGLSILVGCGPGGEPAPAPGAELDYHRDAVVVLDRYCATCHREGGIAPFALSDYASVQAHLSLIRGAVSAGTMPPWMPSDSGVPLRYSRKMRPEDRDLLLRWIDGGAPEGDAAAVRRTQLPAAETVAPPRADLVLDPGADYVPNQNLTDDYRCFLTDPGLAEDGFFAAGAVVPGNASIVHHVIAYEVPAADAATARSLDLADRGPGYTCFGGVGTSSPQTLLVWAPGSVPVRAPDGLAMKLKKGSLVAIQVHYNLLNYKGVGDRTKVLLERSATRPERIAVLLGVSEPAKLRIPAGDAAAKQTIRVPLLGPLLAYGLPAFTIYGNVPHMHTLGTRITTKIESGRVLVDIPRWQFHWQQYYQFKEPVQAGFADTLIVECEYDNSAANQPVVNGQRQPPREVTWGEGTRDEMCLSYMQVALPADR